MSIRLTDWMANKAKFSTRKDTLDTLCFIANKQLAVLKREVPSNPQAYGAAHYSKDTVSIEHLSRLMWGTVPAAADLVEINLWFSEQIRAGCDPDHPKYWGVPRDYDQRVVEMSSFAVALVDCRSLYLEPLNFTERQKLFTWLRSVENLAIPANNWRFFRILILSAIQKSGGEIDQNVLADDLAFIDTQYLGQGWYKDGPKKVLDYYNAFAFHLYGLVYARWNWQEDNGRSRVLLERALEFAKNYQRWFAEDGAQLVYGRSLNYRFASAAFWAELASFEQSQFPVGELRGMWARTMRWWAEQPVWDNNGQLLSGFAYPNLLASEFYTSPVSPFLAFKAFSALRLEESSPFWLDQEEDPVFTLEPEFIADQHLIYRNGGSYLLTVASASGELRHCADKYLKFAYSSDHGLCVESTQWINQGFVGDNLLALQNPYDGLWYFRSEIQASSRVGETLVSVWSPFPGCQIETSQSLTEEGEIRVHKIESEQRLKIIATGHAVDRWEPCLAEQNQVGSIALAEGDTTYSSIEDIDGFRQAAVFPCAPNTNLLFSHACIPAIKDEVPAGTSTLNTLVKAGRKLSAIKA